jgi:hypothetical protein
MEIRCSKCGHLGVAAEVRPVDVGVGLVCGECGHVNVVAPTAANEEESEKASGVDGELEAEPDGASLERIIPEPGDGERCRKCFYLFGDDESGHCPRCGLSIAEGERFEEGQAPWELPAPGEEDAFATALEIWERAESGDAAEFERFLDYVLNEELLDLGVRKLQGYLVSNPDDELARAGIARLARRLEMAMSVAQTRAQSQADTFNDEVKRYRKNLLVAALVFWTAIFLLFSWLFWDNYIG